MAPRPYDLARRCPEYGPDLVVKNCYAARRASRLSDAMVHKARESRYPWLNIGYDA